MAHRFFIPPEWLDAALVHLQGETAHQVKNVLRMQAGDQLIVLDNSGLERDVVLTHVGRDRVQGEITASRPAPGEPELQLTLYQATLKAQKFEWVLQKGTEIGIGRFVPTICRRSVVNHQNDLAKKRLRWQRVIQEAAEQSGRGKLPVLEPAMTLNEAISHAVQAHSLALMPWEEAAGPSLKEILTGRSPAAVALLIGPEGGFTAAEASSAREAGVYLVKLGPRILRAETAGLVASAAILYQVGEWG